MRLPPLVAFLLAVAPAGAAADRLHPPVDNELALKECGACHMAYHPRFLPIESWQKMFADLANHFGADASLSESARQELLQYYVSATGAGTEPVTLRISERPWFARRHDELREADWSNPKVKFKGNCIACHKDADKGIYEDD